MSRDALQIVKIDDLYIDATTNEDHNRTAKVTGYPIESGSQVIDNIQLDPFQLTLDCIVSDTPLNPIAALRDAGSIPSRDAHNRLVALFEARQPITVITRLASYTNMCISALNEPQNADTGDSLTFKISFENAIILTNQRTTVRVSLPVGPKVDKGTKPTTTKKLPDADGKRVSIIQKLVGFHH